MNNHTRTCAHCDADFIPNRGTQKYCTPVCQRRSEGARARARKLEALGPKYCKNCGTVLANRSRDYCGDLACVRTNLLTCAQCEEDKSPEEFYRDKRRSNGYHQYCKPCARELSAIRYRKRNGLPEDYEPPAPQVKGTLTTCEECDEEFAWKTHRARYCSMKCSAKANGRNRPGHRRIRVARQMEIRQCATCKEVFVPNHPRTVNCSSECKKAWRSNHAREKGHKRRALIYTDDYIHINHLDVYKRDGWVCGLCDEVIDPQTKYPDPMSASLDHITPISIGGKHTLNNVQAAHLRCNMSKGNRLEPAGTPNDR